MEEKPTNENETTEKIDLKIFEETLKKEETHGENQGKNQGENSNFSADSESFDSSDTIDISGYLSENVIAYLSESEAEIARKACSKSINASTENAANNYFRPIPSGVKFRKDCLKIGFGKYFGKALKIKWWIAWLGSYCFDLFNHITGWKNQISELEKIIKPESK